MPEFLTSMGLWSLIPFLIFGGALLVIFGFFMAGAFTLLFLGDTERGKDVIAKSLTYFIILLTLFLVFAGVSYLVGRGQAFIPTEPTGGFPGSPIGKFPSAPQFMKIGDFNFSGPFPLSQMDRSEEPVLFVALCKKDQGYDIIDVVRKSQNIALTSTSNYKCWLEKCDNNPANIFIAVYWIPEKEVVIFREAMDKMKKTIDFLCIEKR